MKHQTNSVPTQSTQRPRLPRFIWGDGLSAPQSELNEKTYLVHTHYPRFICTIIESSDFELLTGIGAPRRAGWTKDNARIWRCLDFTAVDWDYTDPQPDRTQLHRILLDAACDYRKMQRANEIALKEFREREEQQAVLN